ncbi:MAG: 6-carboxytetrahydropterin synthase, partial [Planctomycetota bacterium]|nr:6-carboxytetrahydropterin synthase [Planctomycetota bacterium]
TSIAPYFTLQVILRGDANPHTGYLCNVQAIDHTVRECVVPLVVKSLQAAKSPPPGEALIEVCWDALPNIVPQQTELEELRLAVTPHLVFSKHSGAQNMVSVTESFEFAASHRLYCPSMSEEENRALFGKCANPNGHGHNYVVEVTVRGTPDPTTGRIVDIQEMESIVKEQVVDRFDHKHLNLDCPEFADLNPSVENITTVIWKLLDGQLEPARLSKIRVWETPKTYAEIEKAN